MNKLLIIGTQTIHTYNYIELVQDFFDEILLITDKQREGYNISTVEVDFSLSFINLYQTVKAMKAQIDHFRPTIIHIHQANSCAFYGLLASRKYRIPTVLTIWGSDVLVNPKRNFLLKKMTQFNLKTADYLTVDAKFVVDEVLQLSQVKNEILIANFGIGIKPNPIPKENIIYSNRLHKPLYRIDKIILAFQQFQEAHSDWKLVIAATGSETDNLKQIVKDLKLSECVNFVGWIGKEENEHWYSQSRIWVSIPESDATSISLLEAMACSAIPVVSDLPANKEWIDDGVNGIIVKDVQDEFISQALKLDIETAISMNRKLIDERGTKEVNKAKFLGLYRKAMQS